MSPKIILSNFWWSFFCCYVFQIKFLNPMITRRPKLRRQKKIFRQQVMKRPDQLNINVATWGRLLKRNLNFQKSLPLDGSNSTRSESVVSHHATTGELS